MLITARAKGTDVKHAGVVGHAVSDDLDHWEMVAADVDGPVLAAAAEAGAVGGAGESPVDWFTAQ